jgi:hypothetical protein
LTITATDTGAGLAAEAYSFDNGATRQAATTKTFTGNISGTIKVRDAVGNKSSIGYSIGNIDKTAPTGCISINAGAEYTTSTAVTLTLTASDVNSMTMCISNTTTCTSRETYATSKSRTLTSGDESKTVYVQFQDTAGNISSQYSGTIVLDTIAPTFSWSSPSVNVVKSGTDVTYTLTLTETNPDDVIITTGDIIVAGSATIKSVSTKDASNKYTVIVTAGSTNGAVTLTPKAGIVNDSAGNTNAASPISDSFTVDNTAPTISSIVKSTTAATNGSVTITIIATDSGGAGLHATAYSFDNGSTWQSANNKTFTANTGGTIKVRDAVGNISNTGFNIDNIDITAPYATNVTYTPSIATSGTVTVTLTISEAIQALSGWTLSGDATTWKKTYDDNITTIIDFYDLAGNAGSTGIKIDRIDTNKPSISKVEYDSTTPTSGNVIVTITANKTIQQPAGRSGSTT